MSGPAVQRVLFVCMGNICRSPLARAVFMDIVRLRGLSAKFEADSCGTGAWHVGEPADRRAQETARRHGLALDHRARQLDPGVDFQRFHWFIAMDRQNLGEMLRLGCPADRARLLRSFEAGADGAEVPDPYWGGPEGFEEVYAILVRACEGLVVHLEQPRKETTGP